MTMKVQSLTDLQDRRIMLDRDVPPYGYAFVILVGIFMVFLLVWSTQTNRIYVSQNTGTVQASNKTYIMSSYSGSITEMYISEGSYVNEGDLVAHIKSTDIDMQQDNLESQLKIYQTQLDQYNKLLQCVQDDTNYFSETNPEDQPYYYQYETYKSQVSQKTFDATAYQAAGYSDAQIKTMMEQSQSEVEALYYSTMQSISQSITSAQSNVDNIQAQIDTLNTGANDYYIYAPTSGVIHMDTPYKEGMVLSAGSPLATVASENDDLEVVAMVTVNDRPLLHVGDPCKIAITGLSEYSYGTLTGTVTAIDSDVTASVKPSSASQKFTFKSANSNIATVSPSGVITAVGTGATSITVSNGTASAMVTVIVNRSAASSEESSDSSTTKPEDDTPIEIDPVVQAIQDSTDNEIVFTQAEVPTVTGDILNALRTTGKTLCVVGDGYTMQIAGSNVKSTTSELDTMLVLTESKEGIEFELDKGKALPCSVRIDLDMSTYTRLYLYNPTSGKWQYLNSYTDGIITADTAGHYLLTNQNLKFANINWTFFIAGGVTIIIIGIAYIVLKKRYWFW